MLAPPDDRSLYLAYDGNGCMANNPASVGASCAFVRRIELGPNGAEKIVVHNLTSPKQMALDAQGRLYVVEEWPEQVTRWDTATGEQAVVLHNSEYEASGPIEGIAINSAGDIYFSECKRDPLLDDVCTHASLTRKVRADGMFGNRVEVANGGVSGVPLKSGAVWVKRSASGAIEMVARGFFRTRGLALDEPRGYLYVANEANAWDQGTSGCLSQINLASGEVKKVAVGLDYAQFPSLEASTGRVFVPLALHNKLVVYDPRPASAFAPVSDTKLEERNISAAINGASWEATHPSLPTLSVSIDELVAPATLNAGMRFTTAPSDPAESPSVSVWLRIPADQLDLYKLELPYNDAYHAGPDTFALPNAECRLDAAGAAGDVRTAGVCKLSVQPNHEHRGPRWPMLVYNGTEPNYRGRVFPQSGWSASPESYLLFIHAHWYEEPRRDLKTDDDDEETPPPPTRKTPAEIAPYLLRQTFLLILSPCRFTDLFGGAGTLRCSGTVGACSPPRTW